MKQLIEQQVKVISQQGKGKRILFASVPADGHFNPLTGIAVHLKSIGYDVRWYTSKTYSDKLNKLNIRHYPFIKALEATGDNMEEIFPERRKYKTTVAKLNFDIINFFLLRSTEYYADIRRIHDLFPFDLMIADCAFSAIPFIKEKMDIPVISIGILPLSETSKDLPPSGLGMVPSSSIMGKVKQAAIRWVADNILFKKSTKQLARITAENGLSYEGQTPFDYLVKKATLFLQSATPGFEYHRSDLGKNIRFVGPLLPNLSQGNQKPWFDERLQKYEKVILVTQGTVEKNVEKLLVPTLEAFKGSDTLVVATTGGSGTKALQERYPQTNIIVEDFIPFADVMPYTDVYITNGGYGGIMLGIKNELPLVVAGIHEGKNEICARVGFFKLGVNLKTEKPSPSQLKKAVEEVFANNCYKKNVSRLAKEFAEYNSNEIISEFAAQEIAAYAAYKSKDELQEKIY